MGIRCGPSWSSIRVEVARIIVRSVFIRKLSVGTRRRYRSVANVADEFDYVA